MPHSDGTLRCMPTFLLPDEPVTSLDAYLASDIGGLGDRARPADRSSGDDRRRRRLRAPRPGRRRLPDRPEVGGHRRRRPGPAATWCATAPRASRARSRTAPCCGPTPTSSSKASSSRRSPSAPTRRSSASSAASSARSTPSPAPCRSSSRPASAPTAQVTIVAGPDEYLFGEEKAMLEVIEGKPPLPRWFPPYEHGLFATAPQLGWEATPRSGLGRWPEPDPRQQRRDAGQRAPHPRPRSRMVPLDGNRRSRPARSSPPSSATSSPPTSARSSSARRCGAVIDAVGSGVAPGRTVKAVFSGVANPVVTAADLDVPRQLRGLPGDRQRHGRSRVHRLRRHDVHGRRRLPAVAVPVDRVVRPVPALQARLERDHQPPRTTGDRRRQRRRPARDRPLARAGHRRQPLLPRRRGATRGRQHHASVPRGVRRTRRARPVPTPAALPIPKLLDLADGTGHLRRHVLAEAPRLDLRGTA